MIKKVMILFIFLLILSSPVYAATQASPLEKMEDSLVRGYIAASKNDLKTASDLFSKAVSYADKAKSWRGFVDAGNAFAAIGKPYAAVRPLKAAYKIANSGKDWRGLVACAYSFASLPQNLNLKKTALSVLDSAFKSALKRKDWRGLVETAKAYYKLGDEKNSRKAVLAAKKISESMALEAPVDAVAQAALSMSLMDIYKDSRDLAKKLNIYKESPSSPAAEARVPARESAGREIVQGKKGLIEAAKKDKEDMKFYTACGDYYDYPYYYSYYGMRPPAGSYQISGWAAECLSRYKFVDGSYVYGE